MSWYFALATSGSAQSSEIVSKPVQLSGYQERSQGLTNEHVEGLPVLGDSSILARRRTLQERIDHVLSAAVIDLDDGSSRVYEDGEHAAKDSVSLAYDQLMSLRGWEERREGLAVSAWPLYPG